MQTEISVENKTEILPSSKLLEIKGLDVLKAVRRIGDDWELYEQILQMFANDFANYDETFSVYLEKNDWKQAHRNAHTLKSVTGTLGIEGVAEIAATLEKATKEQNRDAALESLFSLHPIMSAILEQLQQFFDEKSDEETNG
jgi:HPt (histidine-containing phosphotransfer) domain-containing protein